LPEMKLGGFDDLAGFQAVCADAHTADSRAEFRANPLQIWQPAALCFVVSMADVISRRRAFSTYLALCHFVRSKNIPGQPRCHGTKLMKTDNRNAYATTTLLFTGSGFGNIAR